MMNKLAVPISCILATMYFGALQLCRGLKDTVHLVVVFICHLRVLKDFYSCSGSNLTRSMPIERPTLGYAQGLGHLSKTWSKFNIRRKLNGFKIRGLAHSTTIYDLILIIRGRWRVACRVVCVSVTSPTRRGHGTTPTLCDSLISPIFFLLLPLPLEFSSSLGCLSICNWHWKTYGIKYMILTLTISFNKWV